jgi:hypothetical protein
LRFSEPPTRTYYGDDAGHPYIVAANDAGFLLHVSPNRHAQGLNLGYPDPEGKLVVAWDFIPVDGTGRSELSATTELIADRDAELSQFSGVKSVGLLSLPAPRNGFVVAELQVVELEQPNAGRIANLTWFSSRENSWDETVLACPDVTPGVTPQWTPHDVIAYDEKLWWADLTRGLLVCNNPADPAAAPHLSFVALPDLDGVRLQDRHEEPGRIDTRRMVRVSHGGLQFVDVVRRRDELPQATRVVVWTLESMFDASMGRARWEHHQRRTTLAAIWQHGSYVESGMPRQVPELAFLHPDKPDVVYFFLGTYLFSVNVTDSAVVQFGRRENMVEVLNGPQPINWRYVLAWVPRYKMVRC